MRGAAATHKVVVLLFLSTACPYANYFSSHMKDLSEEYGPRSVLFVGLCSNGWEPREEVAKYARDHRFDFPVIKDERHVIADRLGASTTPEAFVLDSTGRLRYRGRVMSKQESPDLRRAIEAVLETVDAGHQGLRLRHRPLLTRRASNAPLPKARLPLQQSGDPTSSVPRAAARLRIHSRSIESVQEGPEFRARPTPQPKPHRAAENKPTRPRRSALRWCVHGLLRAQHDELMTRATSRR